MELEQIEMAEKARKNAYTPYSNFKVGAVLKTKSGKYYSGCNVENAGIQSICAERVAFTKAISEGETDFESIAVVGGEDGIDKTINECLPCGYCRQFMQEFVSKDFKIFTKNGEEIKEYKMEELLPYGFKI